MSLRSRLLLARTILKQLPKRPPLWEILGIQLLRIFGWLGQLLDGFLFTNSAIQRPIILIGLPRTGTTFLHRWLDHNGIGEGRQLWHILFPSQIQQLIVRPFLFLMEPLSPTRHHPPEIHKSGLQEVEVDEAGTLIHHFDGFFLYAFLLAHADEELLELVDPQKRPRLKKEWEWYSKLWRTAEGQVVVAKIFGLGAQVPELLKLQPDVRLIYTCRSPVESIPSTLSLLRAVLGARFGFDDLSKDHQKRYYRRVARALLELQRRFWEDWEAERFDRKRVFLLEQSQLKEEFKESMSALLSWLEVEPSEKLRKAIEAQEAEQRVFKSRHRYQLEEFGLTRAELEAQEEWIKELRRRNEG